MKILMKIATVGVVAVAFSMGMTSCDTKHCKDKAPYWCSSAGVCCKYRYHDGKSTCFESLTSCTATGNGCETCWVED